MKKITFSNYYKKLNIFSLILLILSILIIFIKGLNLGVDFIGGTLIEIRSENSQIKIAEIRQSLLKMDVGNVTVKKFGNENDYLVKFEKKRNDNSNFINEIKKELTLSLGKDFEFRRVENVGPKVSAELLKSGIIAIVTSLAAMLFYIWIRF